jgi:hypothetical protein
MAAAGDNQATEPDASGEEKLPAKDDYFKLLQAKVKHQNQHNMMLSLQITKLRVDIADFTVKLCKLDQLYAQTFNEAVRAKDEVDKQCIAHTEELQQIEAQMRFESQLVSEREKVIQLKLKAEKAQSIAHTEELCTMEGELTSKSELVSKLKFQISQLKVEIASALAKQKAWYENLQQEIELGEGLNVANADELKTLKDRYFKESEIHNALIVEFKSQIFNATAKCEVLTKLAQQTKEEAEEKIKTQIAELDNMKAKWKGKCKMTDILSAEVAQLKKQIARAGLKDQEKLLGAKKTLPADQPEKLFLFAVNTMQNINHSDVLQAWVLSSPLGCHHADTDNVITKTKNDDDDKLNTKCDTTEALDTVSTEIANAKTRIPTPGSNKD